MNKPARSIRTDGEVTRSRILASAGQLFAEEGYAETKNKDIALRAEVDVASINYHFGSRSGLYQSVLADAYQHILSLADLQLLAGSDLSPRDKLGKLIDKLVERSADNTDWHACVLSRELMSPSSHFHTLFQEDGLPKLSIVKSILSEITGIPPDDPALFRCLLNVAAPCMMLMVAAGRYIPDFMREVVKTPRQELSRHLHIFTVAGLERIGTEYRASAQNKGSA